jgi:CRISPR-associated endoribonuclease Cas6
MNLLYSVVLELSATKQAALPATTGHQAHALFLDLIRQVDPELSRRLHDEPNYRPFTVSPLSGGRSQDGTIKLQLGQSCRLRLTLLDGGALWQCLSRRFLEAGKLELHLGAASFRLDRMLSTPDADSSGWAGYTDWATLTTTPATSRLKLLFTTPTAFNLGDKGFALYPEPPLVWESLIRVWNNNAPEPLKLDRPALSEYIKQQVLITDYELQTSTLHFPGYPQKGFVGVCTYKIGQQDQVAARQLAALAEFSRYAGVGYKTTMGMGQVRAEYFNQKEKL